MKSALKLMSAGAAVFLLSAAAPAVSSAQDQVLYRPVVPYSPYTAPDGTYDSLADYTRAIRGTPCGINCARAAQERWSRYYARHLYGH